MKRVYRSALLAVGFIALVSTVHADSVSDAKVLLCSNDHGTRCYADGECKSGPPWHWDIPKFIEVDLTKKRLTSTKASGVELTTPIGSVQRDGGQIFLQGLENGRAYSFVIDEMTGVSSTAIVLDGVALAVFGACTPLK